MDEVRDREPVWIQEDGGDVIMGACVGEEAGSRVPDILKFGDNYTSSLIGRLLKFQKANYMCVSSYCK